MTALLVVAAGVIAAAVGLVLTFGAWTLIPVGVVVAVAGVVVDIEGAVNG